MASEIYVKLSEMDRPSKPVNDSDLVFIAQSESGVVESKAMPVSDLRALLNFENAYTTTTLGLADTEANQIFYVYTDNNRLTVNGYINRNGIAEALVDADSNPIILPTTEFSKKIIDDGPIDLKWGKTTLRNLFQRTVSLWDYMTQEQIDDVNSSSPKLNLNSVFLAAWADSTRVFVPPVKGYYLVGDLQAPAGARLYGVSGKPYTASNDNVFLNKGSVIRRISTATDLIIWNSSFYVEGMVFDGGNRTTPMFPRSSGSLSGGANNCGFYRFSQVGGRSGEYISAWFKDCNMSGNNIGLYNTIDGNHIGLTINANKSHGVQLNTGANSNNFTNCRVEWNEGDNYHLYGVTSIQVTGEIVDRAHGYGFWINNSSVTITNVNVRRSGRTADASVAAQFYIETSQVKLVGVTTSAGVDDSGGSITTPSPAAMFRMGGANNDGRITAIGCDLGGFVTSPYSGSTRPYLRIIGCVGFDDNVTEGVTKVVNGKRYVSYGAYNGASSGTPLPIPVTTRTVSTYSNDINTYQVTVRTSSGGHAGCILDTITYREGGNASIRILSIRGDASIGITGTETYVLSITNLATDGSSFTLNVTSASTVALNVRQYTI